MGTLCLDFDLQDDLEFVTFSLIILSGNLLLIELNVVMNN